MYAIGKTQTKTPYNTPRQTPAYKPRITPRDIALRLMNLDNKKSRRKRKQKRRYLSDYENRNLKTDRISYTILDILQERK